MYTVQGLHYATQDDAKKAAKAAGTEFAAIDVPIKLRELADYINAIVLAAPAPSVEISPGKPDAPVVGYAQHSVAIDDAWEGLPLVRKLHFGAMALEEARTVAGAQAKAAAATSLL